jgi:hypothetical protein
MLELLVVLELDCHITTNIVVSSVDWYLHNVFVSIFHLPELVAAGRIKSDLENRCPTKTEQRCNLILPYVNIITICG